MCGILGYAGTPAIAPEMLVSMRDTMSHRGPDDCGLWVAGDGSAGFGHRRLSIIDLTPGGHQPMADSSGRVHITYNGEIYNFLELRHVLEALGHAFRSASDTEVILAAYRQWGEGFVERLIGMFALALYDEEVRVLFLARDRAGEKPLFVWRDGRRIVFASELKAMFALPEFPRRLDHNALEHYLAFSYVPRDLCLVAGVEKLLPGHMLRFEAGNGNVTARRYWDLPRFDGSAKKADPEELADELDILLAGAVKKQMIADVPVGILLSGGLDSSLVTAMAARVSSRPVKTFTISFPGHKGQDEAPFARLVAQHFGTEHTEMPADAASVSLLPKLAWQYDEPIGDSSMVPTYIVSRLIRQHATVALGGDGGDELFGGYHLYTWSARLGLVQRLLPRLVRGIVGRAAHRLPSATRGRNYLIGAAARGFEPLNHLGLYFDAGRRRELLAHVNGTHPTPDELRKSIAVGAFTMLQAAERIDFRSYMVDDILVKVDRASMLASLETRVPFLDPAVVEFAFGKVPDNLKVTLTGRKILLRRLAARLLPAQLDLKRKQGFSVPIAAWFANGEWGTFIRDVLASAPPDLFRPEAIASLIELEGRQGQQMSRLFALTMFELWRREHRISF
ncbi:MAG TPA: asparagine synthase (glutamine-hydrolyzing) [Thermoanaerobaculia bacterium]|nr:asparagine synthase (glutamine-hydrolyzing) [Thermoanaerobaculia bacterium]